MRVFILTSLTMVAFAANSLLCRAALASSAIDPYSFTAIRISSGALVLSALLAMRSKPQEPEGSWQSGLALLGYALAFSLAYVTLDSGTGALILFGAVQVTMMVGGIVRGERPGLRVWAGLLVAMGGLVYLLLPGATAPDLFGAGLMMVSGVSWGVYSLRGKGASNPLAATGRNFVLATPMALLALGIGYTTLEASTAGIGYAAVSGGVTSGLGYALWYFVLKDLTASVAAVVQLSVPVIAAVGGILLLDEAATIRLAVASLLVLGGIALAVAKVQPRGD